MFNVYCEYSKTLLDDKKPTKVLVNLKELTNNSALKLE